MIGALISNSRLVDVFHGNVSFSWRDSAQGINKLLMTLTQDEFLRCFLIHFLPPNSCVFATSDPSPIATVLLCCRCARDYSADHLAWACKSDILPRRCRTWAARKT